MKLYLLTLISFMFAECLSAQNSNDVILHGTMTGDLKGYNKIYLYTRTSKDSAEIVDGKYTFRFPFSSPVMKYLYPEYIKSQGMMYQPYGVLFAAPGDYYLTSDITKPLQLSTLKGNLQNTVFSAFESDYKTASAKLRSTISQLYGEKWYTMSDTSALYIPIQKSSDSLKNIYLLPVFEKLVTQYPDEIASGYALSMYGRDIGSIRQKEQLYEALSNKIKESAEAKDYFDFVSGLKNSSIGNLVSDFTLPDPKGNMIALNSLKGKYVLIDFWASWCWPCRKSFPEMRKMYKKYSNHPFEIYSISIDEDYDGWQKAVKEEKNPWLQSIDDQNISKKLFAVTAIPATFLLDPAGKIIAKEVGFEPDGNGVIQKKLKELFKTK